ncbi:hypothetical protein BC830DRAFT_1114293 [Chytriomyces sp. MP71]|nr:hypothetical protein BC830DRAFT_1114293 [Chytriomyces sp. MP71]
MEDEENGSHRHDDAEVHSQEVNETMNSMSETTREISDRLCASVATLQNVVDPGGSRPCQNDGEHQNDSPEIPFSSSSQETVSSLPFQSINEDSQDRFNRFDEILRADRRTPNYLRDMPVISHYDHGRIESGQYFGEAHHLEMQNRARERERNQRLRVFRSVVARHRLDPAELYDAHDSGLLNYTSLPSVSIIISDKGRYKSIVRTLVFLWYGISIIVAPSVTAAYAPYGACGTDPIAVMAFETVLEDSHNSLKTWMLYMALLTVLDFPRLPLLGWAQRKLAAVQQSQRQQSLHNAAASQPLEPPVNQSLIKVAAKAISVSMRPLSAVLWILISLWLMAGSVWLASSSCATTNPHLFYLYFFEICALWGIGIAWYILNRWRTWYLQAVQMERERRAFIDELLHEQRNLPQHSIDFELDAVLPNFASAHPRDLRRRDFFLDTRGQLPHSRFRGAYTVDPYQLHGRRVPAPRRRDVEGREGWDPALLAMMDDATSDFWAPVDPATFREAGDGVSKEEWDRLKLYTFERKRSGEKGKDEKGDCEAGVDVIAADELNLKGMTAANGNASVKTTGIEGCVVCLCEFEPQDLVLFLACGHSYHEECIARWLKGKEEGGEGKRTCPLCVCDVTILSTP